MNSQSQILDKKRVSPADIPDFVMLQIESFFVTYEDSACDLGAAMAKSGACRYFVMWLRRFRLVMYLWIF